MDLVIRNGTLVDGTGAAQRPADVAVEAGRIREVAPWAQGSVRESPGAWPLGELVRL